MWTMALAAGSAGRAFPGVRGMTSTAKHRKFSPIAF
jgi:hypothetical protein